MQTCLEGVTIWNFIPDDAHKTQALQKRRLDRCPKYEALGYEMRREECSLALDLTQNNEESI